MFCPVNKSEYRKVEARLGAMGCLLSDNLVKGAAGQAVQNMNIMFGLPETTGLTNIALVP